MLENWVKTFKLDPYWQGSFQDLKKKVRRAVKTRFPRCDVDDRLAEPSW